MAGYRRRAVAAVASPDVRIAIVLVSGGTLGMEKRVLVGILLFSCLYLYGAFGLEAGIPSNAGPGLMPRIIAVLLLAAVGFALWSSSRPVGQAASRSEGQRPASSSRIVIEILVCTATYPFLLHTLKFLTATTIVTTTLLYVLRSPWRPAKRVVFAALLSFALYLGFMRLLRIELPSGFFEYLLWW